MRQVQAGTTVGSLLPTHIDEAPVVAALVDRRAVPLGMPLMTNATIEAVTTQSDEGRRYYRKSQGLLLLEAAHRVDPTRSVRLSHSLGFAQRVDVGHNGNGSNADSLGAWLSHVEAAMSELVNADVPLRSEWCTISEARDLFEARGWTDAKELVSFWRAPLVDLSTYGDVVVPSPGPLVPRAGMLGGARLVPYGEGLILVFGPGAATGAPRPPVQPVAPTNHAPRLTVRHLAVGVATQTELTALDHARWLSAVGIRSVGEFNAACVRGDVTDIIRVSEGFQEKRIGAIADAIANRGDQLKIVLVAGPSSSGKTTFIKRLKVQLQVNGKRPVGLSLDDYYCDRASTPRDANGQHDYESFDALQHGLLQEHLAKLVSGHAVKSARYDFHTGASQPSGGPEIQLGPGDILMVEGIHGLNPRLLAHLGSSAAFRVFVCPLTQLPFDPLSRVHVSDVRLLRRVIRDRHERGTNAADNIARWPSVRAGELLHIFPYQGNADAVFDSSLVYELAVLKVYAERYLLEVPRTHPSHTVALRLLELVERFIAIYPDHVPPTSLLREFIGGSAFDR